MSQVEFEKIKIPRTKNIQFKFELKEFYVLFEDFINAWQVNDGLAATFKK